MKSQPMETAPSGRTVLVKHKMLGWIEATFYEECYSKHGFGWDSPSQDYWLYPDDMEAWAELPEEE